MVRFAVRGHRAEWLLASNKACSSQWLSLVLRQGNLRPFCWLRLCMMRRLFLANTLQISFLIFSIFCGVWSRTAKPSSL